MHKVIVPKLDPNYYIFPKAINNDGIVAWGGDLNSNRLIAAYKNGIFPWFNEDDPILWWSPNPRCILLLDDIKISKSLKKSLKKFHVSYDKDFSSVIKECREVRLKSNENTWIDKRIIQAYDLLHKKDFAHSVEVWQDGKLVGGLYGVILGKVFCGESMFSKKTDASKVAFVNLVNKLKGYDFDFIDCQVPNPHLLSLGAKVISRDSFLKMLEVSTNKPSGFEKFSLI